MKIRKVQLGDERAIAKVHVESWRTTYKGILSDDILNNLCVRAREKQWGSAIQSEEILYVALNEARQIIGFASGGKSRSPEYDYDGELYAIYLLERYQRQGIGKQLIAHVADELIARGFQSMIVWVLRDNASKTAYEKLGAVPFASKNINIGGQTLKEDALVWECLTELRKTS